MKIPGGKYMHIAIGAIALTIIALGFFKVISPDSVVEKAAEEVLYEETGIDIKLPGQDKK